MTEAIDVGAELAVLRARVAALEVLADFFLGKKEGWGGLAKRTPHTPAFARASGPHVTWGCSSERAGSEVSNGIDRVIDEWIRFPGDVQGGRG